MLLKNKQIFVAEDDIKNRVIFQMILVRHGARLTFERWGDGAINQLGRLDQVDLIILDLMLAGGISGFQVFDKIRKLPEFNTVPIVAVSAAEPGYAILEGRRKGFSGFIAKPLDDMLFPQQLASILDGEEIWYAGKRC
jgi:two-component system chemotaxis sensor kinase CheA